MKESQEGLLNAGDAPEAESEGPRPERAGAQARGTGFRMSVSWMREYGGEELWEKVVEPLTHDERETLSSIRLGARYDLDLPDKLYRSFANAACGDDLGAAREAFRGLGHYIAEHEIGRVIYRLRKPNLLARLLTKQWELYFPGVEVEVTCLDLAKGRVVQSVRGLGGFAYISQAACGWLERAFEMAGATHISVEEQEFNAGKVASDDKVYEVSWS